jgi:prophage antirepressor-like protein
MVTRNEHSTPRVFKFEDGSHGRYWYVRVTGTSEAPEWVCGDVVAILYPEAQPSDYQNYYAQVPPEWKSQQTILNDNGEELLTTIYESGLYYLMVQSKSPMAIAFQQWLDREVMPAIRPRGNYSIVDLATPQEPSTKEKLETIRLAMDMLYELGGIDERVRLGMRQQIVEILQQEQKKKLINFSGDRAKSSNVNQTRAINPLQKTIKADENKAENRSTNGQNAIHQEETLSIEKKVSPTDPTNLKS